MPCGPGARPGAGNGLPAPPGPGAMRGGAGRILKTMDEHGWKTFLSRAGSEPIKTGGLPPSGFQNLRRRQAGETRQAASAFRRDGGETGMWRFRGSPARFPPCPADLLQLPRSDLSDHFSCFPASPLSRPWMGEPGFLFTPSSLLHHVHARSPLACLPRVDRAFWRFVQ